MSSSGISSYSVKYFHGCVFHTVIRDWRKAGGLQSGMLNSVQPVHDPIPSPTVSASRKKHKTLQSVASFSLGTPSTALHPSMQPSPAALKQAPASGARGKKTKSVS